MRKLTSAVLFALFALSVLFFVPSASADGGGPSSESEPTVQIYSAKCQEQTDGESFGLPTYTNKTKATLQFIMVSHYTADGADILFVNIWKTPKNTIGLYGSYGSENTLPARLWTGCSKKYVKNILRSEYPEVSVIWP